MAEAPAAPPLAWQADFLRRHQLGAAYLATARKWFDPLVTRLCLHHKGAQGTLMVGINGCQGSGKTTLVDYLAHALAAGGLHCVSLSLDDFYLTRAERQALAAAVHPLLATRGVPGTHDMPLMQRCLQRLKAGDLSEQHPLHLPRFDKAMDDRSPPTQWLTVNQPVDIVLFEGWCLGVDAQPDDALLAPVNDLERAEDPDGRWRVAVNAVLARDFGPVHALVDVWVMLAAPSFACVQRWRQEQEDKLRQRLGSGALDPSASDHGALDCSTRDHSMTPAQVARFIQHYQRLTEWSLATLPGCVDELFTLDDQRHILVGGTR
ncbi:hypothetical protein [Parahaliea mediterranea]|uniref:hypothetical protein n=1 Tax=Parahaliea mediterranea TaxID=651086 RepID=UPI001F4E3EAB|nr:hypothetical protein [Parahaliea mediterranea]